jgi:hypothetical protein
VDRCLPRTGALPWWCDNQISGVSPPATKQ